MNRQGIRLKLYILITSMLVLFTTTAFFMMFFSHDVAKVELARHYFEVLLAFWTGALTRFL